MSLAHLKRQLNPSAAAEQNSPSQYISELTLVVSKAYSLNNRCFIHIYFTYNKTRQLEHHFTIAAGPCIYIER